MLHGFLSKAFDNVYVSHIGSTAIQGIWAKPIIDILVEVPNRESATAAKALLEEYGCICMSVDKNRASFNKGYTREGFAQKVFHIHVRHYGDNDELYFRDYLNEFPDVAQEYEQLKRNLWSQYEYNRDAYTNNKSEFVSKYSKLARDLYGDRYTRSRE